MTGEPDDVAALRAEFEALRVECERARAIGRGGALLAEQALEAWLAMADGRTPDPALMARMFRGQREVDELGARNARRSLHEQRDLGSEAASQVLALLSDDPWWQVDE